MTATLREELEQLDSLVRQAAEAYRSLKKDAFAKWCKGVAGFTVHGSKGDMLRQVTNELNRLAVSRQ